MKVSAYIPARLQSERFPRKLLQDLGGKPVILRTFEAALQTKLFDETVVITDAPEIAGVIKQAGGKVFLSQKSHTTGTDRIAEFASQTGADIILNIQGDEPFIEKEPLEKIINFFKADVHKETDIVSLMQPIDNEQDFLNPNNVKVVTGMHGFALYFSRAPIPFPRDGQFTGAYKHIGIYAFRKPVLEKIATLPPTPLEKIEKLENLRFLQYGFRIKMLVTEKGFQGIDTPEDLEKARKYLQTREKGNQINP